MNHRYEDRGMTLRMFVNEQDALSHPDARQAVRYATGWLAKRRDGRWLDGLGPLPLGWTPQHGLFFEIRKGDSLEVREPTVGKWYCACNYVEDLDSDSGEREDHGILAEYVGGGEFYDGNSDETQNMGDADFLIEQN